MTLNKKPIKKDYAKSPRDAHAYFQGREWYGNKYYKIVIKKGGIKSTDVIIDVPSGTGNLSSRIAKVIHPKRIYMIDINNLMLAEARKKCRGETF